MSTAGSDQPEVFELAGVSKRIPPCTPAAAMGKSGIDLDSMNPLYRFTAKLLLYNHTPLLGPPATPPPAYSELVAHFAINTGPELVPPPENSGSVFRNERLWKVKLNIAIQMAGPRSDVQPFIGLGNELQRYRHRVRLDTHNISEIFVRDSGLVFYPIGGDVAELMTYLAKNPGLIPSMQSLKAGEIWRKRIMIREIFAHICCAQALCIPAHLMFTMPWSSTNAFPHPLANLNGGGADQRSLNYVSYGVVNWLTWQGVGDVTNQWRKELDLDEVAMVTFTYCWSPALVPKPSDWPSYVDVCGFFFREPPQYDPPADLQAFLAAGRPPVYIGFGRIVMGDPERMTAALIINAVTAAGVRAIISKGWSNMSMTYHDNIYFVGDCPHERLFENVAAVVHHGGAGTTACRLQKSKPTFIIPFLGDQPFSGAIVAAAGAGPAPIPYRELTVDTLTDGIQYCLSEQAATAAGNSGQNAIRRWRKRRVANLPLERLQCDLYPEMPGVWSLSKGNKQFKLSKIAAQILAAEGLIDKKSLNLHATNPNSIENCRWEPITGGASAVVGTDTDLTDSILGTFYKPFQGYQNYQEHSEYCPLRSASNQAVLKVFDKSSFGNMSAKSEKEPQGIGAVNTNSATTTAKSRSKKRSDNAGGRLLGRMAGPSDKSLGIFVPTALQSMVVDIPLTMTEGYCNLPRLYSEEPLDNGPVTDTKSGFTVAGKGFAGGMAEALSSIVVKPYQGIQEDVAKGAVKGVGRGVANMVAKAGCAMFGVVVYPSTGIAEFTVVISYPDKKAGGQAAPY
ncbi:hypothetical protein BDW71DRAFT_201658 [Aspergillus fruticulosus]